MQAEGGPLLCSRLLPAIAICFASVLPGVAWASCAEAAKVPARAASQGSLATLVDEPDGTSQQRAFPLDIAGKKAQVLLLTSGSSCFLDFSIPLPTRLELAIHPDSTAVPTLQLTTTDRSPNRTINGQRSIDGRQVIFDLYPANYLLELAGMPGRVEVVAKASQRTSPRWAIEPGARTLVRLHPIARSADREIVVGRRSMVSFSLENMSPLPASHPRVGIELRDASGTRLPATEYQAGGPAPKASYIVPAGTYHVVAEAHYNGWPSPELSEPLRSRELTLRVDDIVPADLPTTMQSLASWMEQVGLGGLLWASEVLDLRAPAGSLPRAIDRLAPYAVHVAGYRTKELMARGTELDRTANAPAVSGGSVNWPSGSEERDRPLLVIKFDVKADNRWAFRATESAFALAHGTSMWSRLLQRASALHGVSARRIVMVAPVPCDPHLVFLTSGGDARRHGQTCLSASSSAPLFSAASLADTANVSARGLPSSLSVAAPTFLRQMFSTSSANLEFLTTDDDFVEVVVRGLRGHVIQGGSDWEKLQLQLALTGGKVSPTLRVTADGDLSSGIGGYPPDSSFTRSMEPQYKGPLSDFAKKLANDLRSHLVQGPQGEKR